MSNPFAAPQVTGTVAGPDLTAPLYLNWSFLFCLTMGIVTGVASGVCVVGYQHWLHSFDSAMTGPRRWASLLEAASFSTAAAFSAFSFGVPWRHARFDHYLNRVLVFWVGSFLMLIPARAFMTEDSLSLYGIFVLLPGSQMLAVAAICRIRHVRIPFLRLIVAGVIGFGVWLALTMATIVALVQRLPYPQDDYAGFSLLTALWCIAVSGQIPFLLRAPAGADSDNFDGG